MAVDSAAVIKARTVSWLLLNIPLLFTLLYILICLANQRVVSHLSLSPLRALA